MLPRTGLFSSRSHGRSRLHYAGLAALSLGLLACPSKLSPALLPGSGPSRFARFNTDPPAGDPPAGGGGGGGNAPTLEQLQARLTQLESDNARISGERDGLAGKVKTFEDATKTEADKQAEKLTAAEKRAEELEAKERATAIRLDVEREARKLKVVDEDAAYRLLDLNAVKVDKDGKPTNVAELVAALVKAKPFLLGGTSGGPSGGGPTNPPRNRGGDDKTVSMNEALAAHYAGKN